MSRSMLTWQQLDRIDGAGAVLLARFLDRLDAEGRHTCVIKGYNPEANAVDCTLSRASGGPPSPNAFHESAGADRCACSSAAW